MRVTLPTVYLWKRYIARLVQNEIDFASGNEKDRTVTIYSDSEKVRLIKVVL
jgi:hypothetical protein